MYMALTPTLTTATTATARDLLMLMLMLMPAMELMVMDLATTDWDTEPMDTPTLTTATTATARDLLMLSPRSLATLLVTATLLVSSEVFTVVLLLPLLSLPLRPQLPPLLSTLPLLWSMPPLLLSSTLVTRSTTRSSTFPRSP